MLLCVMEGWNDFGDGRTAGQNPERVWALTARTLDGARPAAVADSPATHPAGGATP
jgi:hypothetical protein